jgi:hypothetical protein
MAVAERAKVEIKKTTEVTVSDFDKTNWRSYTNKKFGFQIMVPNYFIEVNGSDPVDFTSEQKKKFDTTMRVDCSGSAHPGVCTGDIFHYELAFSGGIYNPERVIINGVAWLKSDIRSAFYAQKQPVYNYALETTDKNKGLYSFTSENEELLQKILSTYTMPLPFISYAIDNYDSGELTVTFSAPKDAVKSQYSVSCVPGVVVFFSDNLTNWQMSGNEPPKDTAVKDICGTTQNNTWDTVQRNPLTLMDMRSMRAKNPTDKTKVVTFQMTSTFKDGTILHSIPLEVPFIAGSY